MQIYVCKTLAKHKINNAFLGLIFLQTPWSFLYHEYFDRIVMIMKKKIKTYLHILTLTSPYYWGTVVHYVVRQVSN